MMKQWMKQMMAVLVSFLMLFSYVPAGLAASTQAKGAGQLQENQEVKSQENQEVPSQETQEINIGQIQADVEARAADYKKQLTVGNSANDEASAWDEQEVIKKLSGLIETGFEPSELAAWAVSEFLPQIMGIDQEPDTQKILEKIDTVIANEEIIKDRIDKIDERIVKGEVATNLNQYFGIDRAGAYDTYYGALKKIDSETESDEKKADDRLQALAYAMTGKDYVSGGIEDCDKIPMEMGDFFIKGVMVTYQGSNDNVFGLYHKWCTYKYHWEHQAYADWISFRDYVYTQYLIASTVDKLSLIARIQILEDKGESHDVLDTRLADLKAQILKVNEIYRSTDNEWTGIVKQRPDNVRFYWYAGHDKLLYTRAHQQKVPQEQDHDKHGITNIDFCKGIAWHYFSGMFGKRVVIDGPNLSYWRSFVSYTRDSGDGGGQVLCPSADWFTQVYKDYNSKTDLYTIFFDKNEGNMAAPGGSNKNWYFVVDPGTGHEMSYYDGGIFYADEVVTPVMKNDSSFVTDASNKMGMRIYYYHYYSSEIIPDIIKAGHPFIGIGVADAGTVGIEEKPGQGIVTNADKENAELKATASGKGITLSWTKAEKAKKYEIYQKKVGAKSYKKIKTITDSSKNKLTISKSKLEKKAGYYYYVKITGELHGETVSTTSWKVVVYPTNGKYTNVKSIKFAKGIGSALTLKKGKTKKLGASVTKVKKSKKLPTSFKSVRYSSSDKKVADVSSAGKITAKAAGTCYIYAYGTNGVSKRVKVCVE